MHKVSVIIPTYNRVHTLGRAIESVLQQTIAPYEIIVLDDDSADDTGALCGRYPGVVYIRQQNRGVSAARNAAIKYSKGEWIALLDSDDEWLPDKLHRQVAALRANPDYRLCHTDEIWIRHGVRVNAMRKHQKFGGHIFNHCLPLCAISPSSALIRRDVFDDIGWFDESLPACEDYDYWLRFCARYPVLYVDEPMIRKYGGHADQLSRRYWGMDRFRVRALKNLLKHTDLSCEQHAAVISILRDKCTILRKGAVKHENAEIIAFCDDVLETCR